MHNDVPQTAMIAYVDSATAYILIWQTGESLEWTCDSWFTQGEWLIRYTKAAPIPTMYVN